MLNQKQIDFIEKMDLELPNGAFSTLDQQALWPYLVGLRDTDIYLEIGVDKGKSLAFAVRNTLAQVYGIDIQETPNIEGATFIQGDSLEIAKDWKEGKIELLFIDGDHSYEGCKADIEAWLPHLTRTAQIFFHDCDESSPGVVQAYNELLEEERDRILVSEIFKTPEKNTSMARVAFK